MNDLAHRILEQETENILPAFLFIQKKSILNQESFGIENRF